MNNAELSLIFDGLQGGHRRQGWDHCDFDRIQTLEDGTTFWARQINVESETGPWTVLPEPVVGHA